MNHKKHSRSFSVFYRNSAILTINIEFVYSHKKNSFMTIHSTVSLVSYTKASLAQCIGSIIINITAGESASSTSASSATTKARSLDISY